MCCGSPAATHNALSIPVWVSCKQGQLAGGSTQAPDLELVSSWPILEQCPESKTELDFELHN